MDLPATVPAVEYGRDFWDWSLIALAFVAALGTPISIYMVRLMRTAARSVVTLSQFHAAEIPDGGRGKSIRVQFLLNISPPSGSWLIDRMDGRIKYRNVTVTPELRNGAVLVHVAKDGSFSGTVQWMTFELSNQKEEPDLDFEVGIKLRDGAKVHEKRKPLLIDDRPRQSTPSTSEAQP